MKSDLVRSLVVLALTSSCAHHETHETRKRPQIFIQMPKNRLLYYNFSPLVYQALRTNFGQYGYVCVDSNQSNQESYLLSTQLETLTREHKFISPDLMLYGYRHAIKTTCSLSYRGRILGSTIFYFPLLISNAKNPTLGSHYLFSSTKTELERSSNRVVRWACALIERIESDKKV